MNLNGTTIVTTGFETLPTSERGGVIVVAVVALLSVVAFAFVAFRTIRLATGLFFERDGNITHQPPEILFFRTQLGNYAGCLVLSNLFISAAGLINFHWVSRSTQLAQGSTCSTQGVLTQIGIWGTCWFTAAHGVHTLSSLGFHVHPPRWRSYVGIVLGWIVAFAAGLAPLQRSDVYGPVGTSCAVTSSYPKEKFALEVLPILLSIFVSTAVYSVIFVILRGKLNKSFARKLRYLTPVNEWDDRNEEYYRFICVIIRSMFWFPLAFVLLYIPFCVTHILMFVGYVAPFGASTFAYVCISMSGLVNVGLLCNTARVVVPVFLKPRSGETMKSLGNDPSGESRVVPESQPYWQSATPLHESRVACHSKKLPSDHSSALLIWSGEARSNARRQDAWREPLALDEDSLSRPMADRTNALGKATKAPTLDPKAPFALNLCSAEVTNKSVILAARLGISAATSTSSQKSIGHAAQEFERARRSATVSVIHTAHRLEVNDLGGPGSADASASRPWSSASTISADSDSDYSVEIMQVHRVRPLSRVLEASDEGHDILGSYPHTPQLMRAQSCRASMATVWSQETGHTLSLLPDTERSEAYQQLIANALATGVTPGPSNRVAAGEAVRKPSVALPNPRPRSPKPLLRPIQVASKVSAQFSSMLSPRSPDSFIPPLMVIAPNNSVV